MRSLSKSPNLKEKRKPLKHLQGIQKLFPDLTDQIYQAVHQERMRERKLLEREMKFKQAQRVRKRNSSIHSISQKSTMKIQEEGPLHSTSPGTYLNKPSNQNLNSQKSIEENNGC